MSSEPKESAVDLSKQKQEQLPSMVKSHLPPHLQPRVKKPLVTSTNITKNEDNASTPAVVKRRRFARWFNSPTDAFLSPCTQKLMKPKTDNAIQPLNLDECDDNNDGNEQVVMDCE